MNSQVLIYSPQNQSNVQRGLYGTITLVAWAVYFYLILPLVTLLLWWLGLRGSYVQLWLPEAGFDRTLALTLPLLAVACALLLIGWAEINRLRFEALACACIDLTSRRPSYVESDARRAPSTSSCRSPAAPGDTRAPRLASGSPCSHRAGSAACT